jgi:hypothetical protein
MTPDVVQEVLDTYEIERVSESVFRVRHPKVAEPYTVDLTKGTCTCKAGQAGKACRHLLAMRKLVSDERSAARKQEAERREEAMDLLRRLLEAPEEKLYKTLTPEWSLKILRTLCERLLTLEEQMAKVRSEVDKGILEKAL